jgi:replicative DNA helicase
MEALILPHNLDAERSVLGSALIDPDICASLPDMVSQSDFHSQAHQWMYEAMISLYKSGQPVDFVTLPDELERNGTLNECGGHSYIMELINTTPTHIYAQNYAEMVKRDAVCRRYIRMAEKLMQMAYGNHKPEELFTFIEEEKRTLQPPRDDGALQTWDESFEHYWRVLDRRREVTETGGMATTYPWASWNALIDPAEPGLPILLSGDSGTGKTIYLEGFADWWAMQGLTVAISHFELNRGVMYDRRIVRHTGISRSKLKTGILTQVEEQRIMDAERRLKSWPGAIHYLHTPAWNIDELCREVRGLVRDGMCDALVFDYLDKLSASPRQMKLFGSNQTARLADDTAQWKDLLETEQIVGVSAAQLRKSGKEKRFDELVKEDIQGSGDRANFVNVVGLIHREIVDAKEVDEHGEVVTEIGGRSREARVKIAKNTMGKEGVLNQLVKASLFTVKDSIIDRQDLNDPRSYVDHANATQPQGRQA